jgi:putative phage-type endonuclease
MKKSTINKESGEWEPKTTAQQFHGQDISSWLEARKKGITGTDVGKIMGVSHWGTSQDVYQDKMGVSAPKPDNEPMLWGRLLEPVIISEYSRRNDVEVIKPEGATIGKEDWIIGSPDGIVVTRPQGKWCYGVEVKTGAIRNPAGEKRWSKQGVTPIVLSPDYEYQCRWYMMLCDLPKWELIALLNGNDFRTYTIMRDEKLEEEMYNRCKDFWFNNVLAKVPPSTAPSRSFS